MIPLAGFGRNQLTITEDDDFTTALTALGGPGTVKKRVVACTFFLFCGENPTFTLKFRKLFHFHASFTISSLQWNLILEKREPLMMVLTSNTPRDKREFA